ncbi:cytochrome P450 [Ureibacillus thermosphaericus]|uniref:cytochrome P450 n=1 Tax=Ureibacillus thermosphaericus TaxID=51173 RepID=UPI000BBB7DDC|nr:cytochrome P450 [Ureibacillus thermosphaericus]
MENINEIPRDEGIDHSLALLKEGYEYILNRRKSLQTNIFETRILGKKAICMGGKEAAQLFYDQTKFQRQDAVPNRIIETLFGKNSVQTLDGVAHRHRKKMFMNVLTKEKINEFLDIAKLEWEKALDQWSKETEIIFYEEMKTLLCKAAFKWIGYPPHEKDTEILMNEIGAMFETPIAFGLQHWIGRNKRNQLEKKMEKLIEKIRSNEVQVQSESILHQFVFYKDLNGSLLDVETVAVEIINILRPIVAISIYINFIVMALSQFPHERVKLKNTPDYIHLFIQEVRRFYPLVPVAAAKAKSSFTWNGYAFHEGTLVLLDIYGTNHDSNIWVNPDEFQPERFAQWQDDQFSFIPQGGGRYETTHRCPGEQLTIEAMKLSLEYLLNKMDYEIPEQDMYITMDTIPSIPKSKVILKNVKRLKESIH